MIGAQPGTSMASQGMLLALSIAVLAAGPLLITFVQRFSPVLLALDGFVLVAVGGLVLADVIPHALAHGGGVAVPIVLLGLLGPAFLEKGLHRAAHHVHTAALLLGLTGLMLHAGIDGVALSGAQGPDISENLAIAVLLHRLPEGLTIWWLLRPVYGARVALGTLALVAGATAAGMTLAGHDGIAASGTLLALIEALVGGSLLHVVIHRPHPMVHQPRPGRRHIASGLGALVGALLLWAIFSHGEGHHGAGPLGDGSHGHEGGPWWQSVFGTLALDSAPALLLAYVAAGLVQVALPAASIAWMARGSHLSQALRGMVFGLPLPICSCGVVPVYRSLALAGVPTAAAIAFLVAAPELGLDAALLSVPLLGASFAAGRVVSAALVALAAGWLIGVLAPRLLPPSTAASDVAIVDERAHKHRTDWPQRLLEGLRIGLGEIVDHTGPWVLLGLATAAAAAPLLENGLLGHIPHGWDVPLFALLGMPVFVCASGATPLVAVLIAAGASPGAGLAFLLTGPATNVATLGVLSRMHGPRVAVAFAGSIATMAVGLGLILNTLLPGYAVPSLHPDAEATPGWPSMLALGIVALLFAASLLRQGPRHFVGQILAFANGDGTQHSHDHDHAPDEAHHDHDHDHHDAPDAQKDSGCHGDGCCH